MKKANISLCWYIPLALVGVVGFLLTLLACLEIGGTYHLEYVTAFILSISVFGLSAINIWLEIYNDYLEQRTTSKGDFTMLQYTLYNKSEYVCTFTTYKEAKDYKTYQFNTYGIKLKVKRTYV